MKKPLLFLAVILFLLSACKKEKDQYLDAVTELEQSEYRGQELADKRITEIKSAIKSYQEEASNKSKFFTHSTKDKISILFGYKIIFSLCAL